MTDENDARKAKGKARAKRGADKPVLWGKQRARGFFAASDYVRTTVRQAGSSHGFAESRLLTQWRETVGEEMAAFCEPVRVSYASQEFGATLIVWCDGARAPEVELLKPRLLERVNQKYGYNAISRIHISQSEKPPQRTQPQGPPQRRALTADEQSLVDDIVSDVCDPDLKEALRRLGRNVKSRVADAASDPGNDPANPTQGRGAPTTRDQS